MLTIQKPIISISQLPFGNSLPNKRKTFAHQKVKPSTTKVASPLAPIITKEEEEIVKGEEQAAERRQFSWTKQWYPLLLIDNLDPERPTPAQLFGKDLVVWRDEENIWRCFEDICPHRLVPLSEGRLETDGTLQCAYHGWRFNGKGECTHMPQADPKHKQQLCNDKRSQCTAFPILQKHQILWVWGESGADAFLESLNFQPNIPEEISQVKNFKNLWAYNELPYGYETVLENLTDPAHATVAHHGTLGNRDDACFLEYNVSSKASPQGFALQRIIQENDFDNQDKKQKKSAVYTFFKAPSSITIRTCYQDGGYSEIIIFVTPLNQQKIAMMGTWELKFDAQGKIVDSKSPIPRWLNDILGRVFLQQDSVFLYAQQKYLHKNNVTKPFNKSYYAILQSDKGINEFFRWMVKIAGGALPYEGGDMFVPLPPSHLTDTYDQHTKHCKICLDALANFQKLRVASWVVCALLAMKSVADFSYGNPSEILLWGNSFTAPALSAFFCGFGAVFFAGISYLINKIIGLFYKIEYSHADH